MQRIILIGLTALLTACANEPTQLTQTNNNTALSPVTTFYDYSLPLQTGSLLHSTNCLVNWSMLM